MPLGTGWRLRKCPKPLVPLGRSDFLMENIVRSRNRQFTVNPINMPIASCMAEVWEEDVQVGEGV